MANNEAIKERLRMYRRACRVCDALERRIIRKRADLKTPHAVRTDALPGGKGNSLEAAVERIDALERRLANERLRRDGALGDVRALIDMVDDEDGHRILSLRYIDGIRFEAIPERLFISERSMWRRYNKAISVIAKSAENWQ